MQDALKISFKKPISAADIVALKTRVETNYKVSFNFSGLEFDYLVTLEGAKVPVTNAINTLFPKGREDILTQGPTMQG
jgi:hypothetical protein